MISYKTALLSLTLCLSMQAQTIPGLEALSLSTKTSTKINTILATLASCPTTQEVKKLVSCIKAERKKYLQKKMYGIIATWALENNISWTADFIQAMPDYILNREYNTTTLGRHLLEYTIKTKKNDIVKILVNKVSDFLLTTSCEYARTIKNTEAEQFISQEITKRAQHVLKMKSRALYVAAGLGIATATWVITVGPTVAFFTAAWIPLWAIAKVGIFFGL